MQPQAHLDVSLLSRFGEVGGRDEHLESIDNDHLCVKRCAGLRIDCEGPGIVVDLRQRMVRGQNAVSYGYDGNGQRVTKTVGQQATTYVYDAMGNLAAEYGTTTPPCAPCFVTVDQLGSTRMLTDAQGNVKERHDFMPFGGDIPAGVGQRTTAQGYLNPQGTPGTSILFTGQYRDTEMIGSAMPSGLDYFNARHHVPGLGRFMQPDPVGSLVADPGTPQSWHLFNYAINNPFRFIDPTGMCYQDADGNFWDDDGEPCTGDDLNRPTPSITVSDSVPPLDYYYASYPWDYGFGSPAPTITNAPSPTPHSNPTIESHWYNNSCVQNALLKGAVATGLDAIGLIPVGGVVSRAIGNAFSYRGIVADQFGNKTLGAVQMGAAIISTGSAAHDAPYSAGALSQSL